jgi:hypothetical protein
MRRWASRMENREGSDSLLTKCCDLALTKCCGSLLTSSQSSKDALAPTVLIASSLSCQTCTAVTMRVTLRVTMRFTSSYKRLTL